MYLQMCRESREDMFLFYLIYYNNFRIAKTNSKILIEKKNYMKKLSKK
eukprot:SAG25_NODE_177_length_12713_cov_474.755272_7_plen_48_part_00